MSKKGTLKFNAQKVLFYILNSMETQTNTNKTEFIACFVVYITNANCYSLYPLGIYFMR